ncbi:uncharacterized protein LOC106669021 [Cimex lectularius]|uniref:Uncharacterized protein n=1 Tax=Cimex lectularius TaxID=79782 RepID=A0A8I6S0V3_CIMLE|nr:uncharacterized protein LOC106669021 [Cimex lectularius]
MFLLVLFVFFSESDGEYSFKENLIPYETYLSGPYWTYPVRKNNLIHGPGYFREGLRFKRESGLSQQEPSEHEFPRDVPTKPEYANKGQWAKGKIPGKETELGFVPLQIYSQVRKYDTVKHLPRSDALKEASTAEEVAAAARLREVLRQKKIQQVYEEEGYEDSGYDHGFYNHHGAKYEDKEKNEQITIPKAGDSQVKSAEEVGILTNLNSQSTPPKPPSVGYFKNLKSESSEKSTTWGDSGEEAFLLKETYPKVSGKHSLINGKKIIENDTEKYDVEKIESKEDYNSESRSREKLDERKDISLGSVAAPRSGVVDEAEVRVINDPRPKGNHIVFPGRHTKRQYALGRPINNWTPMAPADVYIQGSIGYQLKRPFFPGDSLTHHYVPYVPFPNFYSDNPTSYASPVPHVIRLAVKPTRSPLLNTKRGEIHGAGTLTAYASLVPNNLSVSTEIHPNRTGYIQPRSNNSLDLGSSKTRIVGRERHYNNFTRGNKTLKDVTRQPTWNINKTHLHTRHPSLPRDGKEKFLELQRAHAGALVAERPDKRAPKSGDWPVKYIEQLTIAHYSSQENNPITPIQNNTERLIELTKMLNAKVDYPRVKREATINFDEHKYPFYHGVSSGSNGNKDSALKYATNPDMIPKKTLGGMEFYESRDRLVRCKDPSPPEDIIPERKEDGDWNKNVQVETPRMKGLGDSIQCMKNKYFGKEPLDNPFFQEGVEPMTHRTANEKMETAPLRKLRNGDTSKRQTTILNQENTTKHYHTTSNQKDYSNHKMNHDNNATVFPYKNHRQEFEPISPGYDSRIVSPYPYYIENSNNKNYYSVHENSQESGIEVDVSKPRYRPPHHFMYTPIYTPKKYKPKPVSIYSIISHKGNPQHYRPLLYAHSIKTHRIVPMYPYLTTTTQSPDNIASDTQSKPVKWYIIRPGEYTENKELAEEKKETPSIWSYMNPLTPLKWWFPSLFDNRRKEPRYRERRDVDYEQDLPDDKGKPNMSSELNVHISLNSDASNKAYFKIPTNHRPESSTKPQMSLDELQLRLNMTDSVKSRLSRLSGGYISRSNASFVDPMVKIANSSLPLPTAPTTRSLEAPTGKSKLSFPRTKIPQRKYLQYQKPLNADKKTMRTTTTTRSPTTTVTRMYKPKKIINPKFVPRTPVDAFSVLKAQTSNSESPFDSSEIDRNPRELQQVEHRRVTKEETYKRTYTPQVEARENREGEHSEEEMKYSAKISDSHPLSERSTNGTLTYLVDPATGIGVWGEMPRRRDWKPKKKAKSNGEAGSIYSYPSGGRKSENLSETQAHPTTKKNSKKQKEAQYENEAYIVSLMRSVPLPVQRHPKRKQQFQSVSSQRGLESAEGRSIEVLTEEPENYPSPPRTTTVFIRDPDKRKYFYVND